MNNINFFALQPIKSQFRVTFFIDHVKNIPVEKALIASLKANKEDIKTALNYGYSEKAFCIFKSQYDFIFAPLFADIKVTNQTIEEILNALADEIN